MPKKDRGNEFTRRSVLKGLGASTAAAGFSLPVTAVDDEEEKREWIEYARGTDSFQLFEEEFGAIRVDEGGSTVTRDEDEETVRVELKTNLGRMGVLLLESEEESVDFALLDLPTADPDQLPTEYERYATTSSDLNPLLFAPGWSGRIEFRRGATSEEKAALARKTGIPESDLEANFESELGGFVVADEREVAESEEELEDEETVEESTSYFVVEVDEYQVEEYTTSQIESGTVVERSASPEWGCTWDCASCLARAAGCTMCCIAASLGCIICIIWRCGVGASSCYSCLDCLL